MQRIRTGRAFAALAATCAGAAAHAQEESALARPEPEVPILWLAPPPAAEPAPEERRLPLLTLLIPPPPSPNAMALPPAARALLERAMADGSPESFAAVAKLARDMYPSGGGQIDALSAENEAKIAEKKAADAREKADALAAATFLDNWKGEAELGASLATGNSRAVGLYGAFKANKEGLRWRHALTARADYAETDGIATTERIVASYQPRYKVTERLYFYGIAQFEHDRFLGYDQRYTTGPGLGYTLFPGPRFKLDIEGGPAARRTVYIDADPRWSAAARGSVSLVWKPSSWLTLNSDSALYLERRNSNISSTTSLDSRLIGPLKARLSYTLTYEQDTPDVSKNANTLSRVSLVYDF
ncbi:DUF481 domain-containing protein [Sphingomonas morindae]|uniref:DUF481 domain-containing protein n=1 Tax=Sphingomonas morindae TaxID=1541170 RepID=A0ABY4X5L4_9SPHN|nr:DUF481 domain-containing protein [Sphingomonas morindae]USI72161.1 DUF481 domain-containing protein [Sphingomonas morindae]